MAQIDNKVKIEIPAFDMMNILATLEMLFDTNGYPTNDVRSSFLVFKDAVMNNTSNDAMEEALAQLRVNNMMNEVDNNRSGT